MDKMYHAEYRAIKYDIAVQIPKLSEIEWTNECQIAPVLLPFTSEFCEEHFSSMSLK